MLRWGLIGESCNMSLFFKNKNEQRDYISKKLKLHYPNFNSGCYFLKYFLDKSININCIILDAGCGENGIVSKMKHKVKLIIGVDLDKKSLLNNKIVDKKILSNLELLPLENNSIDVIVCEFVLEHLKNPESVLKEFFRVLKPGGSFIFITSNILNPVMFFSKILPYFFHEFLREKFLKNLDKSYPTYYKINTYKKILHLFDKAGFYKINLKRAGNPEYIGFCRVFVPISILFEKFIDNRFLSFLKMYLIGFFKK